LILSGIFSRLTSLRARTLAVICAVVVIPVVFVWLSSPFEDAIGHQMRQALQNGVADAAHLVRTDSPISDFEELAEDYGIWIRVIDGEGNVELSSDGISEPSFRERMLFAPSEVPEAESWDRVQRPIFERKLVATAAEHEKGRGHCKYALEGTLLMCEFARHITLPGRPARTIYAVTGSPRAISALYDDRNSVLKLTILVMMVAILLGVWLGWRIGRPLDELREQVLARVEPVVSTTPIEVEGDDEFAQLRRAFNRLLSALSDRNEANQAFMADMAHEVKNPVAAIRAAAESLDRKEIDQERAERISRILKDSSRRLDHVVQNFLELARAEAGLPTDERKEIRLDELAANLASTYADDPRFAEIELETDLTRVVISASPEALETALRNLLQNAASFADSRVILRAFREGDEAVIEVSDDGPGIDEKEPRKVFERFYTRRDDGGGTGLGLAMVRAIANAHGGIAEVESKKGEGALFRMRLPVLTGID